MWVSVTWCGGGLGGVAGAGGGGRLGPVAQGVADAQLGHHGIVE